MVEGFTGWKSSATDLTNKTASKILESLGNNKRFKAVTYFSTLGKSFKSIQQRMSLFLYA